MSVEDFFKKHKWELTRCASWHSCIFHFSKISTGGAKPRGKWGGRKSASALSFSKPHLLSWITPPPSPACSTLHRPGAFSLPMRRCRHAAFDSLKLKILRPYQEEDVGCLGQSPGRGSAMLPSRREKGSHGQFRPEATIAHRMQPLTNHTWIPLVPQGRRRKCCLNNFI